MAILLALEHAQHCQEATVLFHSYYRMAVQALQQLQHRDNMGFVTTVLGSLQSLAL